MAPMSDPAGPVDAHPASPEAGSAGGASAGGRFPFPAPASARRPSAAPPGGAEAPATVVRRRRVRWMDTAVTLLLAVSAGGVMLVATPPLLRAAGFGSSPRSDSSVRRPMRSSEDPQFFEGDEELAEPRSPHGGLRMPVGGDDDDEPRDKASPLRMGRVERPVKLFEKPGGGGEAIGELSSGATVMLVRDQGDWVLVVHNGDLDISMGWTRRSDIAVR